MVGQPSYEDEEIIFILEGLLNKQNQNEIKDGFHRRFDKELTKNQIRYVKTKHGKDPRFNAPAINGRQLPPPKRAKKNKYRLRSKGPISTLEEELEQHRNDNPLDGYDNVRESIAAESQEVHQAHGPKTGFNLALETANDYAGPEPHEPGHGQKKNGFTAAKVRTLTENGIQDRYAGWGQNDLKYQRSGAAQQVQTVAQMSSRVPPRVTQPPPYDFSYQVDNRSQVFSQQCCDANAAFSDAGVDCSMPNTQGFGNATTFGYNGYSQYSATRMPIDPVLQDPAFSQDPFYSQLQADSVASSYETSGLPQLAPAHASLGQQSGLAFPANNYASDVVCAPTIDDFERSGNYEGISNPWFPPYDGPDKTATAYAPLMSQGGVMPAHQQQLTANGDEVGSAQADLSHQHGILGPKKPGFPGLHQSNTRRKRSFGVMNMYGHDFPTDGQHFVNNLLPTQPLPAAVDSHTGGSPASQQSDPFSNDGLSLDTLNNGVDLGKMRPRYDVPQDEASTANGVAAAGHHGNDTNNSDMGNTQMGLQGHGSSYTNSIMDGTIDPKLGQQFQKPPAAVQKNQPNNGLGQSTCVGDSTADGGDTPPSGSNLVSVAAHALIARGGGIDHSDSDEDSNSTCTNSGINMDIPDEPLEPPADGIRAPPSTPMVHDPNESNNNPACAKDATTKLESVESHVKAEPQSHGHDGATNGGG